MKTQPTNRLLLAIALMLSSGGLCAAQDDAADAPDLPDGLKLVTDAAKTMGGAMDATEALHHVTIMPEGMTAAGAAPAKVIVTSAAPAKLHLRAKWDDGREAVAAYDGEHAWSNEEDDPAFRLKPPDEVLGFGPIITPQSFGARMVKLFDTFQTVDIADVGNITCYVVEMSREGSDASLEALIEKESGKLHGFLFAGGQGELIIEEWEAHESGLSVIRKAQITGAAPEPVTLEYKDYEKQSYKKRLWKRPDSVQREIDAGGGSASEDAGEHAGGGGG